MRAVESFAVPFALVGHLNELASADGVPTEICGYVHAINFLRNQSLLFLGTDTEECIRVFIAVGNPEAMGV